MKGDRYQRHRKLMINQEILKVTKSHRKRLEKGIGKTTIRKREFDNRFLILGII